MLIWPYYHGGSWKFLRYWKILSKIRRAPQKIKNWIWVPLSLLLKTFLTSGDQLLQGLMIYVLLLLRTFWHFGSLFLGGCSVPEGGSPIFRWQVRWVSTWRVTDSMGSRQGTFSFLSIPICCGRSQDSEVPLRWLRNRGYSRDLE